MTEDLVFTTVEEQSRTYKFADRDITYQNVNEICVRPSGTHRLNLSDGTKVIVSSGWYAIDIVVPNWTF
ncbi:MAG TPA: hypothetical protein VKR58_05865 [Aquella sp.]|nr:hypothetical protein [Aquella sp.]